MDSRPDRVGFGLAGEECRMEQIFRHAFQHNIWGDPESVSGPGSGLARTALFRERIPPLLAEIGAKSLLDAGCGDFNWMKELKPPGEQYIGIDIVSELITHNIQKFGRAGRRFIHGDILCYDLPKVDVILCRDCLVHFSFGHVWAALRNFKKSGSDYLLATTFIDRADNFCKYAASTDYRSHADRVEEQPEVLTEHSFSEFF